MFTYHKYYEYILISYFYLYLFLCLMIDDKQLFIQQQSIAIIKMRLSEEEKVRFARIMFNDDDKEHRQLDLMTLEQLQKLRSVYAQKITYESVNGQIEAYNEDNNYDYRMRDSRIPNLMTSVLCCCYPEYNQDYFDITSSIFLKRLFNPFIFWNNRFFQINNGKPEQYGLLWLIVTLTIILGFSSNLNKYFIEPANFKIQNEVFMICLGICIVFKVGEPLIYSSVLSCLGGYMQTNQSLMLSSYSLILYFLPTIFCMIPSLYWHVLMIGGSCIIRAIYLYRNYVIKLETKTYILLLVILIIQFLYAFIILRTLFVEDAGYLFSDGFKKVFGENPAGQITNDTAVARKAEHLQQLYLKVRHFQN